MKRQPRRIRWPRRFDTMERVAERVTPLTPNEISRFMGPLAASRDAVAAGTGTVHHYQLLLSMFWCGHALERKGNLAGGRELIDEFGQLMESIGNRIENGLVPRPNADERDCIRATVELLSLQIAACTWAEFCAARITALSMCKQAGGTVLDGATGDRIIQSVMQQETA